MITMPRPFDGVPVGGTRRGQPEAFGAFYERYAHAVLTYFVRRVFDAQVALDLTAETFAAAFESRARLRGTTTPEVEGWLWSIARHQLSHFLRQGRSERRALQRLGIELPSLGDWEQERILELAGIEELRENVADVLDHLPQSQRQALELRVLAELPYAQVAARLGITEQAARSRVSRALASLYDALPERSAPEGVT